MIAAALLALAAAQGGIPDSVAPLGEPNPYAIFGPRTLFLAHVVRPAGDTGTRRFDAGSPLGTIQDFPTPLSQRHQRTIDEARGLYGQRRFADAAAVLTTAYRDEPDNPFVMNEYARTLFWIDARRDEAYSVYQRLIRQLDEQHGTNERQVAIDAWFVEAYWKMGSLHLDRGEWERAAFEITRFMTVLGGGNNEGVEQAFTYLAEAYVRLGRTDAARWNAERALQLNPQGAALQYLYELGPAARDWGPRHLFTCRPAGDSPPCVGLYTAFGKPGGGILCAWPRDREPTTALSPCLRIGWVHVGQARPAVERILGRPWRSMPPRGDLEGHAYLVFRDSVRDRGSYYMIEYERVAGEQVARSVQFTGDSTPLPLDFSGLRPGDPSERAVRQLGNPETRGEFNDEAQRIRGDWWDWGSAGISLEIVGGRIFSIRLFRPTGVPPAAIGRYFSRFR